MSANPQPLARTLQLVLRAQKRAIGRQQFGVCQCGRAVSQHFDVSNHFIACHDPRQSSDAAQPVSSPISGEGQ